MFDILCGGGEHEGENPPHTELFQYIIFYKLKYQFKSNSYIGDS